ncbi:MAG: phosphatidylinositol mannoside acyltransferase [Actinomycetota bacterium]
MTSTSDEPALLLEAEHETPVQRAYVFAYRVLGRAARAMPEKTGRAVAKRVGRLAYRSSPHTREVVAANQAQVLGRPVDDALVVASTREAFELYARYFVDSFHLPQLSDEDIVARVRCDTEYRLHDAADAGKGGICALPHLGNWDAAGRWMKAIGLPALAVAEELEPRRVYELFVELRASNGMDVVGLSDPDVGRKLAAALGEGRIVALVADRDFSGRGVEVEMFGRARTIPAGPALLSLTTGAPLMVTPTYTTPDGWRIEIGEPLSIEPTGDRRADVRALTALMARSFEEAIAAAPSDWHLFQAGWS